MVTVLPALAWCVLAAGAFLVGVSKTALPGVNTISVALYAAVLPAKLSTGVLLVLLMIGDVFALWSYRRHAHWPTLVRMVPAVLVGLVLGAVFLAVASVIFLKWAVREAEDDDAALLEKTRARRRRAEIAAFAAAQESQTHP